MARDIQGKANIGDRARLFFRNNNIKLPKVNKLPNLKGLPRAGALSAVFAGLDYFNRKDTGQTETQAISGAASGAVGGTAGFSLASGVAAKALSPLLVTPIPGSRLLYGALVLGAGIYGGMKGSELFGKASDKITGVEARAMGGSVMAGKPYLVGELGPELVVPKISGTVINNMKTEQIYQMLYEDKPPAEALADLMGRQRRAERRGVWHERLRWRLRLRRQLRRRGHRRRRERRRLRRSMWRDLHHG